MFLLIAKLVKNSHILARIFFTFLENVLKQTWNSFNIKIQRQCVKRWETQLSNKATFSTFFDT